MDFGTGVVKITPAHDANDFAVGERHGLEAKVVIDASGCMSNGCKHVARLPRFKARDVLVELLEAKGLLRDVEDHAMVGECSAQGGSGASDDGPTCCF